ncbi:uncharacterized protein Dana_GF14413 [Drosophila ananassae]|uniref:Major facilitator superfamily (MFS) profile domain-containing protein n=1 Tax=Drosophila ananassae TaxID=7217 RepID=B3MLH1_DROAN|nr:putative inorganic phosphate cotransporter [Drosophila ananassae]EDV31720.1 uncharacterized protein Dana_GF14413 [Drosophila ananassae]
MLPAVQQKLSDLFLYLEVKQRVVLCCFTLLAIINAYTMRLCLDFSLNRMVLECGGVRVEQGAPIIAPKSLPNWRMELATLTKQTDFNAKNRLKAGQEPRKRVRRRTRGGQDKILSKPASEISLEKVSCAEMWSRQTQSLVVVAFYVGYIITHVPGGRLAEQYGGKWVLGVAILTSAVLTLLTPAAVRRGGPYVLLCVRLCVGLCEGPCFPAVCALLAQWVPEQERGLLATCVLSGGEIGIIMVQLVSGLVLAEQDWPVAFYLVGTGAVLWFLGFALVCYSKPDACPFIQDEEREYIKSHTSADLLVTANREEPCEEDRPLESPRNGGSDPAAPWRSILTSGPLWALVSASLQHDWNNQKLPQELQQALDEVKRHGSDMWSDLSATITVAAPHIGTWIASLSSGRLSDFLISQGILSRTQTRRLMSWLVFVCGSMNMLQDQLKGTRIWSVLAMAAYYAGIKLLPLDMSPNFAGTVTGISGGLAALPDLLMPYFQELEANNPLVGSVRAALWIIGASYISGDVQDFNQPEPEQQ